MTDDRIRELAEAYAAAVAAADVEQLRSIADSMSEAEWQVVQKEAAETLLKMTEDRISRLTDSIEAAGSDTDRLESVIENMSESDRADTLWPVAMSAAFLKEHIDSELASLGEGPTPLDLTWAEGPFMFQTLDEISRIVALCANITFRPLLDSTQTAEYVDEKDQERLSELLAAAEQLAEQHRPPNQGFSPITLSTRWTLKLGRKTHAAVVTSDLRPNRYNRFETICGRGSGIAMGSQPDGLDHIDCRGCRNGLSLGGFLDPD